MYHRARTHRVLHKTHTLAVYLYKMQWMCRVSYRDFYFDGSCLCSCYSIHPNMKCIQTIQLGKLECACAFCDTQFEFLYSVYSHTHTHFALHLLTSRMNNNKLTPKRMVSNFSCFVSLPFKMLAIPLIPNSTIANLIQFSKALSL